MMNLAQLVDADLVASGGIRRPSYSVLVRVYGFIVERPQARLPDIVAALDITPAHASTTLAVLVTSGRIERLARGLYRVKR
jgi:predicted transcriptional regulator